nr:hypothetical protein CFP56_60694 [Quercus suber]
MFSASILWATTSGMRNLLWAGVSQCREHGCAFRCLAADCGGLVAASVMQAATTTRMKLLLDMSRNAATADDTHSDGYRLGVAFTLLAIAEEYAFLLPAWYRHHVYRFHLGLATWTSPAPKL